MHYFLEKMKEKSIRVKQEIKIINKLSEPKGNIVNISFDFAR